MTSAREPAATADAAFIKVRGLCKSFAGQPVYENFDLDLPRGAFTTVFGPNGCGKSTLINMMSGLVPFDGGQVEIGGRDLRSARIGYVFQNYRDSLFPWMSALQNIEYPLRVRGIRKIERRERVDRLLALFGITLNLAGRTYDMSGGQQQLVAILRALISEPDVLFLDEPFSALDYEMTLDIREKLQRVFLETGLTTVLVSHDLEEAVYLADRILLLSKRPTRVVECIAFDAAWPRTTDLMATAAFVQTKQRALEVFRAEMQR